MPPKRGPYQTNKIAKIRLDAVQLFFTYPKCDVSIDSALDQITLQLRELGARLLKYIICQELHEDGYLHLHAWLRTSNPLGRVAPDYFDLTGFGDDPYQGHGNYQTQIWEGAVQKYVSKGCDYKTNLTPNEFDEECAKSGRVHKEKFSWEYVCEQLLAGVPLEELTKRFPQVLRDFNKMEENLKRFNQLQKKPRLLNELKNEWRWGPTGSGKSRSVNDEHPDAYIKNSEEFWGGYDFQRVVHMADVDSAWGRTLYLFKIWCDYYIFAAKIKHKDPIDIRPEIMIVTSQYTIRETYERMFKQQGLAHDEELILAVERRFKQVRFDLPTKLPDVFPVDYFLNPSPPLYLPGCDMDISYDKIFD